MVFDICRLQTTECRLQNAGYRLQTAYSGPQTVDYKRGWLTDCWRQILKTAELNPTQSLSFWNYDSLTTWKTIWVCVVSVTLQCRRRWRWPREASCTVYWTALVHLKISDQLTSDWQRSVSLYPFRADSCEIHRLHRRLIKKKYKKKTRTCSVVLSLRRFL